MPEKVLIVGAGGFAGSHAVDWIHDHSDMTIIGLDSFSHMGDTERVSDWSDRYQVFYHDFNAPVSSRLASVIGPVDYIINCASISHVDTSISDPLRVWENNTRLIGNLLEYAKQIPGLKLFIHCSTDEVFGPAKENYFFREWDVHTPSNPYAASKSAQDALCCAYKRTFGLPICITHSMNMIGPKQDPQKFLPKVISRILSDEVITIHGTRSETGSRMYIDVRNVADAWLHLIRYIPTSGQSFSDRPIKYNIAGVEISNLDLVERVSALIGKWPAVDFVPFDEARPGHDRRYALDRSSLSLTGWTEPIPLERTLRDTILHIKQNPIWQEK